MGVNLRKFGVLTWKTLIVKRRHYIETALDLIVPTFLFMIMAALRYQGGDFLKPEHKPDEIFDTNRFLDKICWMPKNPFYNATFYYAPDTNDGAVEDLMNKVLQANAYFENGGCSPKLGPNISGIPFFSKFFSREDKKLLSKSFFKILFLKIKMNEIEYPLSRLMFDSNSILIFQKS